MSDLVTVKAARPHSNDYGDAREQAVGDSYTVSKSVAASLLAGGWIDNFKGKAGVGKNEVHGRAGTGKSVKGAGRKGSDKGRQQGDAFSD